MEPWRGIGVSVGKAKQLLEGSGEAFDPGTDLRERTASTARFPGQDASQGQEKT